MARDVWPVSPLESLCNSDRGITYGILKVGEFIPDGVPVIRGGDIRDGRIECDDSKRVTEEVSNQFRRTILSGGEIVLNLIADPGHSAIVPKALAGHNVSRDVAVIPLNDSVESRFVDFFLKSKVAIDWLTARLQGSVTQKINLGTLRELPVPIPPISEQRAIASVLGSLDDKIELNRRINETLEALAQSLFKSWFADATQSSLPVGWRYATIGELCEINSWTLSKGDELDRIEYVEISEVMRGNIANIQTYERGEEPSRARRRLRHGDTVLSTVRPDRGAYFLCLNPSPSLIGSTGFAVLTPTKAPWSFIHAALTQQEVFEYLGQQADGGAYPVVRPGIIGELEVQWPSQSEVIEKFHRACAPLYERAELNRQESRTLAALRDALLPKLLSGELRVPPATQLVEAEA